MKAIDTNVVIRFLVHDDVSMTAKARRLFETARDDAAPLLIPNMVLLETFWVLGSAYGFSREAILEAVERLLALPSVCFESPSLVRDFARRGRISTRGLADILIGLNAKAAGAETTFTFDKKAAQTDLFTLITDTE